MTKLIFEQYTNTLKRLHSRICDPNTKNYDAIFTDIQTIHMALQETSLIVSLRKLMVHHTSHDDKLAVKISALDALYLELFYPFISFYHLNQQQAFLIRKSLAIELLTIMDNALSLNVTTLSATIYLHTIFVIAAYIRSNQSLAPEEINHAYDLIHIMSQRAFKYIEHKRTQHPAPAFTQLLTDIERQLHIEFIFFARDIYTHNNESETRQKIILSHGLQYINRVINGRISLSESAYFAFIEWIVKTPTPNFDSIWMVFKKILAANTAIALLNEHVFRLFFASLCQGLDLHVVFKKPDIATIFSLFDIAIKIKNVSPELWGVFLNILVLHKDHLTENQYKKLYFYAEKILKIDDQGRFLLKDIFLLLSFSNKPDIAGVRRIHEAIKNKQYPIDIYTDNIMRMLTKTTDFSLDDMEYFFSHLNTSCLFDHLFQTLSNTQSSQFAFVQFCNRHVSIVMQPDILFRKTMMNQVLRRLSAEAISQLVDETQTIHSEYQAYSDFEQLKDKFVSQLMEPHCLYSKKMINAFLSFQQSLDSPFSDATYLPSDKKSHLESVFNALHELQQMDIPAKEYNIKINGFHIRFYTELKQEIPDITKLCDIRDQCQTHLNAEITKKTQTKENAISLNDALIMLKKGEVQDLHNIDAHLVVPADCLESHLVKIKCLIKLGYFENAHYWLDKTQKIFPEKCTKGLLISWAWCCKALRLFEEALGVYQRVLSLETVPQLLTLENIAHCHLLIGKKENLCLAYGIYNDLLQNAQDQRYKNIIRSMVQCLSYQNKFDDAERLIKSLPVWRRNAFALATLGWLSTQKNNIDTAISWYEQALSHEMDIHWMQSLLSCYQQRRADVLMNKKKQLLINALETYTDDDKDSLCIKVSMYLHMRQYENALDNLTILCEKWGETHFTYVERARCYVGLNRLEEAIALLSRFPDYKNNRRVLEQLALCYRLAGKHEKALKLYDYLLIEFSSYPHAFIKAIAYFIKLDDKKRVNRYWEYCQEQFVESQDLFLSTEQLIKRYREGALDEVSNPVIESVNSSVQPIDLYEETLAKLQKYQSRKYNPRLADEDTKRSIIDSLDLATGLSKFGFYGAQEAAIGKLSRGLRDSSEEEINSGHHYV